MTDYRDGKWHGWNGGECPVHEKDVVHAVFLGRNGFLRRAYNFGWDDKDTPIVAFRVVEKHQEPKTIWLNEYETGTSHWKTEDDARNNAHVGVIRVAVKYQEVIDESPA